MPKLTARRTPEIEGLLQELWSLRPELQDKNKLTILLGLDALVREFRGKAYLSAANNALIQEEKTMREPILEDIKGASVSDDVEWD